MVLHYVVGDLFHIVLPMVHDLVVSMVQFSLGPAIGTGVLARELQTG